MANENKAVLTNENPDQTAVMSQSGGSVDKVAPLTRRGFLRGASGLALAITASAALAGCGGGGGGDDNNGTTGGGGGGGTDFGRYVGTYRYRDNSNNGRVAVSFTVDENLQLTYWTLYTDPDAPFADFGQTTLDNNGSFSLTTDGVTTSGQIRNNILEGRTEQQGGDNFSFDFRASLVGQLTPTTPGSRLIGAFEGFDQIGGIDYTTILGVSPDGNATFFGAFDDPSSSDVDYYYFEGLSINRNGDVPNTDRYFLNLYNDRILLRAASAGDVRLNFRFGDSAPDINANSGDRVDLILTPINIGRARPDMKTAKTRRVPVRRNSPALKAAVRALRSSG